MNNKDLIYEGTKIIEAHLNKYLSINDLSKKVGYSLFHFIRLFSGVVGCTPGEYQSFRRVYSSTTDIKNGDKVIDVALKFQFSSSEAFSRSFKKIIGVSPLEFRKNGSLKDIRNSRWSQPFRLTNDIQEDMDLFKPEIVLLDPMIFAGQIISVKDDYTVIGKLWNDFRNSPKPIGLAQPESMVQCSFWSSDSTGELNIMAAWIVDRMEFNSYVYKQVPKANYIKIPHYGDCNTIYKTYEWLFIKWLPTTSYKLTLPYSLEMYNLTPQDIENGISAWILIPTHEEDSYQ